MPAIQLPVVLLYVRPGFKFFIILIYVAALMTFSLLMHDPEVTCGIRRNVFKGQTSEKLNRATNRGLFV